VADRDEPTPRTGSLDLAPSAAVERAIERLRRSMSRRHLGQRTLEQAAALGVEVSLQDLIVIDAIEQGPAEAGRGVTVGVVADRGAMDASRASRVVAGAVHARLVRRVADQDDARRIHLELTELGQDVAAAAHAIRQAAFSEIMRDWSPGDRDTFARLLTRFTQLDT